MKKNLHYPIGLGKIIIFACFILISKTDTIAQNTIADSATVTAEQGIRMIDVDLSVNPRFPIMYSEIPDTIFVYEKLDNNELVLYDKYAYDKTSEKWFSVGNLKRPCVEISNRNRKDAKIIYLKPDRQNPK